jgi:excisionase family DNA binding protein
MPDKLLLTVQEAAYALNCSAGTVYKLVHSGNIGFKKQGRSFRVSREDIESYAKSNLIYSNQAKSDETR